MVTTFNLKKKSPLFEHAILFISFSVNLSAPFLSVCVCLCFSFSLCSSLFLDISNFDPVLYLTASGDGVGGSQPAANEAPKQSAAG